MPDPVSPPPRARLNWAISNVVLVILIAGVNVLLSRWFCFGLLSSGFGVLGSVGLAILVAGMLVSYKKRHRDEPENCDHCGWKLRPDGVNHCFICGAYQRGYCDNCGYDLTGNTSGACPECGEAMP